MPLTFDLIHMTTNLTFIYLSFCVYKYLTQCTMRLKTYITFVLFIDSVLVIFVLLNFLDDDFCAVSTICAFSIFLLKFGWLSGHLSRKWLPIRLTICFLCIST